MEMMVYVFINLVIDIMFKEVKWDGEGGSGN